MTVKDFLDFVEETTSSADELNRSQSAVQDPLEVDNFLREAQDPPAEEPEIVVGDPLETQSFLDFVDDFTAKGKESKKPSVPGLDELLERQLDTSDEQDFSSHMDELIQRQAPLLTKLSPDEEARFKAETGWDDNPLQFYDARGLWKSGGWLTPEQQAAGQHGDSRFKLPGHPRTFMDEQGSAGRDNLDPETAFDTSTGERIDLAKPGFWGGVVKGGGRAAKDPENIPVFGGSLSTGRLANVIAASKRLEQSNKDPDFYRSGKFGPTGDGPFNPFSLKSKVDLYKISHGPHQGFRKELGLEPLDIEDLRKGDLIKAGELREKEDIRLLTEYVEEQHRLSKRSKGEMVGESVVGSLSFMAEFWLGGGVSATAKQAIKKGLSGSARKWLIRTMGQKGARAVTGTAKFVGDAGVRSSTLGIGSVSESVTRRRIPGITLHEDGKFEFTQPTEAPLTSLVKGYGDVFAEYVGELSGAKFRKPLGKVFTWAGDKVSFGQFKKILEKYPLLPSMSESFRKHTGIGGFVEENVEEFISTGLRHFLGIEDANITGQAILDQMLVLAFPAGGRALVVGGASVASGAKAKIDESYDRYRGRRTAKPKPDQARAREAAMGPSPKTDQDTGPIVPNKLGGFESGQVNTFSSREEAQAAQEAILKDAAEQDADISIDLGPRGDGFEVTYRYKETTDAEEQPDSVPTGQEQRKSQEQEPTGEQTTGPEEGQEGVLIAKSEPKKPTENKPEKTKSGPSITTTFGVGGQPDAFEIRHDETNATVIAFQGNRDMPGKANDPTMGEVFLTQVPEESRGRGVGYNLTEDSIQTMSANGAETVKLNATSPGGRSIIDRLIKNNVISAKPIETAETGPEKYQITLTSTRTKQAPPTAPETKVATTTGQEGITPAEAAPTPTQAPPVEAVPEVAPTAEGVEGEVLYHGTDKEFDALEVGIEGTSTSVMGIQVPTRRHAIFLSPTKDFASFFGKNIKTVQTKSLNTFDFDSKESGVLFQEFRESVKDNSEVMKELRDQSLEDWGYFDDVLGETFVAFLKSKGYDSARFIDTGHPDAGDHSVVAVFDSDLIAPTPAADPTPTQAPPTEPAKEKGTETEKRVRTIEAEAKKVLPISVNANDIDLDVATRAHSNLSHHPERAGLFVQNDYLATLINAHDQLGPLAKTDEQKEIVRQSMEDLKKGYLSRTKEILARRRGTASSFVAGPSNFPAAQMNKKNDMIDRKEKERQEFVDKVVGRVKKKLKKQDVEESGGEAAVIREKLAKAEKRQEDMKAANAIVRKKGMSDEEKVFAIKEKLNISEATAQNILQKDDFGRAGFPKFELTNNLANIKRMRERVTVLEAKEGKSGTELFGTIKGGGEVVKNYNEDRLQIDFPFKPDAELRGKLKMHGWRWSPTNSVWQRKLTDNALNNVKLVLGNNFELAEPAGAVPARPEEKSREGPKTQQQVVEEFPPPKEGMQRLYHGLTRVDTDEEIIERVNQVRREGLKTGRDVGTVEGADVVFADTSPMPTSGTFGLVGVAFDVPASDVDIVSGEGRVNRSVRPDEIVGIYPVRVSGESLVEQIGQTEPEPADPQTLSISTDFSGAGTMEAALRPLLGNFTTQHVAEFDPKIVELYNEIYGTNFEAKNVLDVDPEDIRGSDLYHASPVCKSFSKLHAGKKILQSDIDSAEKIAKNIRIATPKTVSIENVREFADHPELMDPITEAFNASGYTWDVQIHNAADYGAPMNRVRMIIRGVRDGELPPVPKKTKPADWFETIKDLIPDAPDSIFVSRGSGSMNWELKRINRYVELGKLTLDKPILTMGGSASKGVPNASNAGDPGPSLASSERSVPRLIIPNKGKTVRITENGDVVDGTVKRVTPRMMARLMGLPDTYKVPEGTPAKERLAKTVLGNGIHGKTTENFIAPLLGDVGSTPTVERPVGIEPAGPAGPEAKRLSAEAAELKRKAPSNAIRDAEGSPLVVYHGSLNLGDEFTARRDIGPSGVPRELYGIDAIGTWFTSVPEETAFYTQKFPDDKRVAKIVPAIVKADNPLVFNTPKQFRDWMEKYALFHGEADQFPDIKTEKVRERLRLGNKDAIVIHNAGEGSPDESTPELPISGTATWVVALNNEQIISGRTVEKDSVTPLGQAKPEPAEETRNYKFRGNSITTWISTKTGRPMTPNTVSLKFSVKATSPEEAKRLIKEKIDAGVTKDQERSVRIEGTVSEIGHKEGRKFAEVLQTFDINESSEPTKPEPAGKTVTETEPPLPPDFDEPFVPVLPETVATANIEKADGDSTARLRNENTRQEIVLSNSTVEPGKIEASFLGLDGTPLKTETFDTVDDAIRSASGETVGEIEPLGSDNFKVVDESLEVAERDRPLDSLTVDQPLTDKVRKTEIRRTEISIAEHPTYESARTALVERGALLQGERFVVGPEDRGELKRFLEGRERLKRRFVLPENARPSDMPWDESLEYAREVDPEIGTDIDAFLELVDIAFTPGVLAKGAKNRVIPPVLEKAMADPDIKLLNTRLERLKNGDSQADINKEMAEEVAWLERSRAGGVPPAETLSDSDGEPSDPDTFSARHAQIEADLKAWGRQGPQSKERRSWGEAVEKATARNLHQPDNARQVAVAILNNPKPLDDIESAGLVMYGTSLKDQHNRLLAEIARLTDPADIADRVAKLNRVEKDFDLISTALYQSGSERGRALASQKMTLNMDMDLVSVLNRSKANKGKELSPDERKELTKNTKEYSDLRDEISVLQKQVDELLAKRVTRVGGVQRFAGMSKPDKQADFRASASRVAELLKKGCM